MGAQQSLLQPMSPDEVAARASKFIRGLGGRSRAPQEAPPRDFEAAREIVWHPDGRRFVLREYVDGTHTYHAFERSDALFYNVEAEDLGLQVNRPFGRIDTRRPARAFDPVTEYDAGANYRRECYREALELIRELCPETVLTGQLGEPGNAVFEGPGRVLMLARPETRYRAALAARRPT